MKNLKLKDGNVIAFTDNSTIYSLTGVYNTFEEVGDVREQLTPENLVACEFDGVEYHKIIPVGVSATSEMSGNITAVFTTRDMTRDEIIDEQQAEQDDAINFLLMGAE